MPFPYDKEKTKLIERLQKELPANVEAVWNENTLIFQRTNNKEIILNIQYGCPVYPSNEDAVFYVGRIKSILNQLENQSE